MKQQQVIVTYAGRLNSDIDDLLKDGWRVLSMISESVSSSGGGGVGEIGRIIILLEK